MAITVEGLIKNRDRHEKDDRGGGNDASRYVMGWNNERKKDALISKRNKLNEAIIASNEILQTCKSRSARLQKQFYAVGRLKEHKGFEEINIAKIQKSIRKAQEQIGSLTDEQPGTGCTETTTAGYRKAEGRQSGSTGNADQE